MGACSSLQADYFAVKERVALLKSGTRPNEVIIAPTAHQQKKEVHNTGWIHDQLNLFSLPSLPTAP